MFILIAHCIQGVSKGYFNSKSQFLPKLSVDREKFKKYTKKVNLKTEY